MSNSESKDTLLESKPMSNNNSGFDPRIIDLNRPIEATFKIGGWILVMPALVAVIWGIYSPSNFMSVLGISARRSVGGLVEGSKPIGESLYNATSGKGLRPGDEKTNPQNRSLRPSDQQPQPSP